MVTKARALQILRDALANPDGFSINEMKKQYSILANQARKWIKMMVELQLIVELSDDRYLANK